MERLIKTEPDPVKHGHMDSRRDWLRDRRKLERADGEREARQYARPAGPTKSRMLLLAFLDRLSELCDAG